MSTSLNAAGKGAELIDNCQLIDMETGRGPRLTEFGLPVLQGCGMIFSWRLAG